MDDVVNVVILDYFLILALLADIEEIEFSSEFLLWLL
jgi:hypothetical protein